MRNIGLAHGKKYRGINRFALYRASQATRSYNPSIVILRTDFLHIIQAKCRELCTNMRKLSLGGILG